jgi:hypothetical protein
VDDVVQGVDLEAEQGLVGLGGEVVEAGDEEADDADQGVDDPDGQGQQLGGMPGGGVGRGASCHEGVPPELWGFGKDEGWVRPIGLGAGRTVAG